MLLKISYIAILFLAFVSCNSEDSFLNTTIELEENSEYQKALVEHNQWIYDNMKLHYLWYIDIPDSASLNFTIEPNDFFDSLLSQQDRFSWCERNINYAGNYDKEQNKGFEYQTYEIHGSLVNRVLYVSSFYLKEQGLRRGDYINIQGGNIVKEEQQEKLLPIKNLEIINVETRSTDLAPTISLDTIYLVKGKKVGYFIYDQFNSSTDVAQIAIKLKNRGIDDLILDLRYNPGGYVSTSNYLASMLAPTGHLGKLYQLQCYNDKLTREKQKKGASGIDSVFLNKGSIIAKRNLNLSRLVVLTTKNTASASESLIIGLRPYMKVITIGTTSCGKDVGSYTIADNRYKYQLQPITFKYYNALNESTPTTGIVPDIYVEDDLEHQRGDTNEALLKAALEYLIGEIPIGTVKDRSVSQPKMKEVGRSSIEIKNNL